MNKEKLSATLLLRQLQPMTELECQKFEKYRSSNIDVLNALEIIEKSREITNKIDLQKMYLEVAQILEGVK